MRHWASPRSYFVLSNRLLERLEWSLGASARHVMSETSPFGLDLQSYDARAVALRLLHPFHNHLPANTNNLCLRWQVIRADVVTASNDMQPNTPLSSPTSS